MTVATGDGWENAESEHLRRFLELAGRTDIPVFDGAIYPPLNTVDRMRLHEEQYGVLPWKGVWGGSGSIKDALAEEPVLTPLPEGRPVLQASHEQAAQFMIRAVHAHPHRVTIFEAGAMTNLALAIRLDPEFPKLARQLIFMGGLVDTNMSAINGNAAFTDDFNMVFDPEAAHITLTVPWAKITVVGNISSDLVLSKEHLANIAQSRRPVAQYVVKYMKPMLLWDEMAAAIVVDPSLITKSQELYMDVDTIPGINYGRVHLWKRDQAPFRTGVKSMTIVEGVDEQKFLDRFIQNAKAL
nr:nucleoside hydrolase [Gluconobacter japonicus]